MLKIKTLAGRFFASWLKVDLKKYTLYCLDHASQASQMIFLTIFLNSFILIEIKAKATPRRKN
jgi:hypothetical protein